MKYFAKSSLGVLAALSLLPATAQAGTYSPSPSGGTTPTVVEVKKGLTLLCTLTATTSSNGSISTTLPSGTEVATLTIASPPNPLCGLVAFTGLPYDITTTSATDIVFNDVRVTGVTGNCRGNLKAKLVSGVLQFTHANSTIPSDPPGGSPCSIQGNVPTSPTASYPSP
jgi:hypothetical protein